MTERDVLLPICDDCGTVEFDSVAGRCQCGGMVPTHVAAVGISGAEVEALRRERDEARAERDNISVEAGWQKARYEEALAARDRAARAAVEDMADWRDEAERYREALERIAALAFDPGDRNDLAAAMAREALRDD